MSKDQLKNLAVKYRVEDLPESLIPGTSLANVLRRLELAPEYIPEITKEYLLENNLKSLLKFACKELSFYEFSEKAQSEQKERRLEADRLKKEKARQAAISAEYRKKQKRINRLFNKFELIASSIEKEDFQKLQDILERVDRGARLNPNEVAWLMIDRKEYYNGYYTQKLREKYHENEAEFHSVKFLQTRNPWDAINASSHYRKCNLARKANSILNNISAAGLNSKKLQSAFKTTLGGVKRDLKKFDEALSLGNDAHLLTPRDFRPCTLLGAVNMEIGKLDEGHSWYKKAVERGATEKSVDDDLRSIFMRLDKTKRQELADFLRKNDPERFNRIKKYMKSKETAKSR